MKIDRIVYLVILINLKTLPAVCQNIQWSKRSDLPVAISKASAALVEGNVYIIGGFSPQSKGFCTSNFEYNPKSDSWTKKKDIPTGRINYAMAVVRGKIYVIGGDPFMKKVEVFDPKFNTWDSTANMPTGRQHISCAVTDNKIYVIGGLENRCCPPFPEKCDWEKCTKISDQNEAYDPMTSSWKVLKPMRTPRQGPGIVSVNGKIYVIGGMGNKSSMWAPLKTVEEYDPATDIWTSKKDMPTPRDGFGYSVQNDKIYLFGGWVTDQEQTKTTIVYDTKSDTWTFLNDIPVKTGSFGFATDKNKVYIFGGDKEDYSEVFSFCYQGVFIKR